MARDRLRTLHASLQRRGGFLVVDEAFVDATPELSLAPQCPASGLIVYRSLGKFFGLAGVRLGFLLAPAELCAQLSASLPPWSVSHPARWVGEQALADRPWQHGQRARLAATAGEWLAQLRERLPLLRFTGTALFATGSGRVDDCRALFEALARRAVLARLFDERPGPGLLRFGLPAPAARERVLQLIDEAAGDCACAS